MIVELKKVKITKAIFNQLLSKDTLLIGVNPSEEYEILGWVFINGKYLLIQDKQTKELFKLKFLQHFGIDGQNPKIVNIRGSQGVVSKRFLFDQDAIDFCRITHLIQSEAKSKGQLYI